MNVGKSKFVALFPYISAHFGGVTRFPQDYKGVASEKHDFTSNSSHYKRDFIELQIKP